MIRPTMAAIVTKSGSGERIVSAPTTGTIRWQRLVGEVLMPGSRVGFLMQGQVAYDLILPPGESGQVQNIDVPNPWTACTYGQRLGSLVAPNASSGIASAADATKLDAAGLFTIVSPTHGTFYRRPAPDSPPYVEEGQTIHRGDTVGLVEVMKCFSPITFDPPEGVESGVVREQVAADGVEVPTDGPLLRIAF